MHTRQFRQLEELRDRLLLGDDAALAETWTPARVYEPVMGEDERESRYAGWLEAVSRVRSRE